MGNHSNEDPGDYRKVKDLFSQQAEVYARYRPGYPEELFQYILQYVVHKNRAWDCATGNGQAAVKLSEYFERVDATDISEAQLKRSIRKPNIHYSICAAEKTLFADNSFDLITIATAYHWLNWKYFHQEALRVGKNTAVVAAWAYRLVQSENKQLNELILHFYRDITGPYWDPERKHVDASYTTVEFNFSPLPTREFLQEVHWNRNELKGFLSSWSAVQHFIKKNGRSPLLLIDDALNAAWNDDEKKKFTFPLFLRMGRIIK